MSGTAAPCFSVSCTVPSLLTTAAQWLLVSEALSSHREAEPGLPRARVCRTASGHREG